MPNAQLSDASGRRVALFDLLRGPHASVLDIGEFTGAPALTSTRWKHFIIGESGAYRNDGHVLDVLARHRITVRPDGYSAAIEPAAVSPSPVSDG